MPDPVSGPYDTSRAPAIGRPGWHTEGCDGDTDPACKCFEGLPPPGVPVFVTHEKPGPPPIYPDHHDITTHDGEVIRCSEAEMWKGLVWDIISAHPEKGLPHTTLHAEPHSDTGQLVIYYTRVELSETQTEMIADLIREHT